MAKLTQNTGPFEVMTPEKFAAWSAAVIADYRDPNKWLVYPQEFYPIPLREWDKLKPEERW